MIARNDGLMCVHVVEETTIGVREREVACVYYSQWCGLGGSSLGCATVELAKLLKAADEGLMQRGTRFELIWSRMKRCSLSLTLLTQVRSLSQSSSKALSASGSKSRVYWRIPDEVVAQQE